MFNTGNAKRFMTKQEEISVVTTSMDSLSRNNIKSDKHAFFYHVMLRRTLWEIKKILETHKHLAEAELDFLGFYVEVFSACQPRNMYSVSFDNLIVLYDKGIKASVERILLERKELLVEDKEFELKESLYFSFYLIHDLLFKLSVKDLLEKSINKKLRGMRGYLDNLHNIVYFLVKAYNYKYSFMQDSSMISIDDIRQLNEEIDQFAVSSLSETPEIALYRC
ncbi:MAG: hypothetical protein ABH821_05005 [archaeon]